MTDLTPPDVAEPILGDLEDDRAASQTEPAGRDDAPARSLWDDAWREMRSRPLFWVAAALIVLIVIIALVPQLFTHKDPTDCQLTLFRQPPSGAHWFGTDTQGCDVYARTIYGARASVLVGVMTTLITSVVGVIIGTIAAYIGGWVDAVLSRLSEIFFVIPLLLGGILFMYVFPSSDTTPYLVVVFKVVAALSILGWPQLARVMRGSVLQVKNNEYVLASKALGGSPAKIIISHIIPNSIAPIIVVGTINLGAFIASEATLSFLGIGLQPPAISWGIDISNASAIGMIRSAPWMLLFPSALLSITVLAFILLGDVVRDALDPKLR